MDSPTNTISSGVGHSSSKQDCMLFSRGRETVLSRQRQQMSATLLTVEDKSTTEKLKPQAIVRTVSLYRFSQW